MKRFTLLLTLFVGTAAYAQQHTMTFSHSPITPNDTLWVAPGDTIEFVWGGGGPHPMTSGHGTSTPSPVFFPTVTVTSSSPKAQFTLDTVGTYLFHCGTNPSNSNNWGTIIVEDVSIDEHEATVVTLFPNPALNEITIERAEDSDIHAYEIYDLTGRRVLTGTLENQSTTVDISSLPSGNYRVTCKGTHTTQDLSFSKQ